MLYMLDTNIVSYKLRGRHDGLMRKLEEHEDDDLCISSIAFAELEFGVRNSSNPARNQAMLSLFLSGVDILPFDEDAGAEYGDVRKELTDAGNLIGSNDLLIAAHARSLGATLVTHNTREFSRVRNLAIEDWAREEA